MLKKFTDASKNKINSDKVEDRNNEIRTNDNLFFQKFGHLKKASVLLFYGRVNDSFNEIAKAA